MFLGSGFESAFSLLVFLFVLFRFAGVFFGARGGGESLSLRGVFLGRLPAALYDTAFGKGLEGLSGIRTINHHPHLRCLGGTDTGG